MKKLLILLTAILLASSVATVVIAVSTGPEKVTYTPKMGTVTFDHSAHQKITDCETCHHTKDYARCKSCHGVKDEAPKAKKAYHKQCKDCHKKMKKGPTKCKECHVK